MSIGKPRDIHDIEHMEPREILEIGDELDVTKLNQADREAEKTDEKIEGIPENQGHLD